MKVFPDLAAPDRTTIVAEVLREPASLGILIRGGRVIGEEPEMAGAALLLNVVKEADPADFRVQRHLADPASVFTWRPRPRRTRNQCVPCSGTISSMNNWRAS
jgi:hypothetical protein